MRKTNNLFDTDTLRLLFLLAVATSKHECTAPEELHQARAVVGDG